MAANYRILEAFNRTRYQLTGHGKRNVQVLKEAFELLEGSLDSDIYGNGNIIEDFQNRLAEILGKESAVFFPSGTMAQQIALRIWSDRKVLHKVAYHPLSHLEIHEKDGLKELHHIQPILIADKDRPVVLDDVLNLKEDISCLLLELPQREIGGQLPAYEDLEAISAYCRGKGIKLHLDGARLLEVCPYYEKSPAEICRLFDSVYISFYKGIGAIAGAILAGETSFTEESKVWKRRHGGDLISLYPYIVSADYYMDLRLPRMKQYYEDAKELAQLYNQCEAVTTRPPVPVSNMFHVHVRLPRDKMEAILVGIYEATDIGFTSHLRVVDEESCYFEVSIGDQYGCIPSDQIAHAFQQLRKEIAACQ
ncbi:threonine aldolase family protein [Paenibacillus hexagrammi]|uniref:Beta-eliminating lyase-related protein n=1 Tax=Paenibacillus hexagrammi TaxID=2908839 RepID=A0ABY3SN75_9BACL|nr:beta-eliminating lyase-related protein [Paenibacillus sp. YPD9-1]UJF34890.1 beta-eliminating lyase-related protein [Paenibacillus sp. YPD9-1]